MWVIPNLLSISEMLLILLITIERYIAIVYPEKLDKIFTKAKMGFYIFIMFLLPTLWCVPSGLGFLWNYNLIANIPYNFTTIYVFYILPLILVIVLYSITLRTLRRYESGQHGESPPKSDQAGSKLVISWIFVIIFLILAYVPNSIWWSMSYYYNSFWMNVFSLVSNVLQVCESISMGII